MQENRFENRVITIPNLITSVRFFLIPVFIALYVSGYFRLSALTLAVSGLLDALDGFVARRFRMESRVGRLIDPIADKLTQAVMWSVMISRYSMMVWLTIVFVAKEIILLLLAYLYMRKTGKVSGARWYGKACTVIQFAMILTLILFPNIRIHSVRVISGIAIAAHILSLMMYIIEYTRKMRGHNPQKSGLSRSYLIMYLLGAAALFILLSTSGDSYLADVVPYPIYLFLRFASIVGTIGIPAFFWGEKVPRSWFDPNRFPFKSFKWENNGKIYDKIHIQKWKNKTPDMSKYMAKAFPKQGNLLRDPEHLKKLVAETCSAEFVHWILILCSPLFAILMDEGGILCMILYIIGNLISLIIQRYNRPRIMQLIERMEKRK